MKTKKRKCMFLIHPRGISDFYRRLGNMFCLSEEVGMKYLPYLFPEKAAMWLLARLKGRFGFTVCSHFKVNDEVDGYIIAVLLTSDHMKKEEGKENPHVLPHRIIEKRIIDAIVHAQQKLGVERVGLGAYTAPLTFNGQKVVSNRRIAGYVEKTGKPFYVTHGDSLTAYSTVETVKKCVAARKIDIRQAVVAVVGAYGIVGRGASILLSKLGPRKMILTGPNFRKLCEIKEEVKSLGYNGEVWPFKDNEMIKDADIVVLATTANGSVVTAGMLKRNAIVVDMAQPHNMSQEVCDERPDVLRVDGGYMSIGKVSLGFEMGPPKGTSFACLTETLVSTIVGDGENHVGPVDVDFAKDIYWNGENHGFTLAPLTNFSIPIAEVARERRARMSVVKIPFSWKLVFGRVFSFFN